MPLLTTTPVTRTGTSVASQTAAAADEFPANLADREVLVRVANGATPTVIAFPVVAGPADFGDGPRALQQAGASIAANQVRYFGPFRQGDVAPDGNIDVTATPPTTVTYEIIAIARPGRS